MTTGIGASKRGVILRVTTCLGGAVWLDFKMLASAPHLLMVLKVDTEQVCVLVRGPSHMKQLMLF